MLESHSSSFAINSENRELNRLNEFYLLKINKLKCLLKDTLKGCCPIDTREW